MGLFRIGRKEHMPALKPQSPYVGKFKVSLPKELSRKEFFIERQQPGGTDRDCPIFDQTTAAYFKKDLDRIYSESNNLQELQWIANEMFSHYFWPPSSLGIFYRNGGKGPLHTIEAPLEGVRQINVSDLTFGSRHSLTEHIIKDNRATYIPDTSFRDYVHILQIYDVPKDEQGLIEPGQVLKGENIAILKTGWDISSIIKKISPYSRCMFMMPFHVEKERIGFLAVGFGRLLWEKGSYLPIKETFDQYFLGDYLKMALANFVYHPSH
jgi:hypothetical protein